jgi:hypothetical protein
MKKYLLILLFWSCTKSDPPVSSLVQNKPITSVNSSNQVGTTTRVQSSGLNAQDGHSVTIVNEGNSGAVIDSVFIQGIVYLPDSSGNMLVQKGVTGNMWVYISNKPVGFFVECFMSYASVAGELNMTNPDYNVNLIDSCQFQNVDTDSLTQIQLKRG